MESLSRIPTASQHRSPEFDGSAAVKLALTNWRRAILKWFADEHREAGEDRTTAEDGLAIAYRNPGMVREENISAMWDELGEACITQSRIVCTIEAIEQMDTAELLVLFSRTTEVKSWPWEGAQWELPLTF